MRTPRVVRRKRAIRIGSAVIAFVCAAAVLARIHPFDAPAVSTAPPHPAPSSTETRVFDLVNLARVGSGASPLALSQALAIAARRHSDDMALRGYLAHDSPVGDTPADRIGALGLTYNEIGENVYSDDGADPARLPEHIVAQWLNEPRHRQNLLSPRFQATAIAISRAPDGSFYATEDFIR